MSNSMYNAYANVRSHMYAMSLNLLQFPPIYLIGGATSQFTSLDTDWWLLKGLWENPPGCI